MSTNTVQKIEVEFKNNGYIKNRFNFNLLGCVVAKQKYLKDSANDEMRVKVELGNSVIIKKGGFNLMGYALIAEYNTIFTIDVPSSLLDELKKLDNIHHIENTNKYEII